MPFILHFSGLFSEKDVIHKYSKKNRANKEDIKSKEEVAIIHNKLDGSTSSQLANRNDNIAVYTIAKNDTWKEVYKKYKVCSCFIREISENSKSWNTNENGSYLITKRELIIPLSKSSDPKKNPDGYMNYTSDKIGKNCLKANCKENQK